jgi:DNA-binding HxlR family transcriptional regulator
MTTRAQTHRDSIFRQQPGLFDYAPPVSGIAEVPAAAAVIDVTADHGPQSRNETYAAVAADHEIARSKWLAQIVAAGRRGVTVDELSDRNDVSPNTISGRITELAREKLVVRTAQRRETRASTAERRITASVIVATRFLTDDASTQTERNS